MKTPIDEAVAVAAPHRSSDRLSADAPEWHPSSCFTATAATIVENTPTPPVPRQADCSPVEAVADSAPAADAAAAAADEAVLDADTTSPEREGVDQVEREIPVPTPTPAATATNASLPEENGVSHAASPTAVAADAAVAEAPVSTTAFVGVPIQTDEKCPPLELGEAGGDASAAAAATVDTVPGFPSPDEVVSAAATTEGSVDVIEAAPTAALSEETVGAVKGRGGREEEGVVAQPGAADAVPAEVPVKAEAIFKKSEDCARVAPSPTAASAETEAPFSRKDDDLLSSAAAVPAPPQEVVEAAVTVVAAAETETTVVCAAEVVLTAEAATTTTSSPDHPTLHDPKTGVADETNGVVGDGGGGGGCGEAGDGRSKAEEAFYRGAAKEKLGAADGEELVPDAESTGEATDRTEDGGSECFDAVVPSKGEVDNFFSNGNGGKSGGKNGGGGENGNSSSSGGSGKGYLTNPTLRWGIAALAAVALVVVGVSRGRRPR